MRVAEKPEPVRWLGSAPTSSPPSTSSSSVTTRVCEKLTPTPGVAASLHPSGRRDAGLPSVCRASSDVHRVAQSRLRASRSRHVIRVCRLSIARRGERSRRRGKQTHGLVENDGEKSYGRPRPKVVRIDLRDIIIDPERSSNPEEASAIANGRSREISRREIDVPRRRSLANRFALKARGRKRGVISKRGIITAEESSREWDWRRSREEHERGGWDRREMFMLLSLSLFSTRFMRNTLYN